MIELRRVTTQVEDIFHEFGPLPGRVLRRGAVCAVLRNPFAGRYEPDILPMMEALNPLGLQMAGRLLQAMALQPGDIQCYGKGAVIGSAGELEHGALWHVPGGYAMRELLGWKDRAKPDTAPSSQSGNALAIVPSTKKVGGPGTRIDIPLTHINASYVRSHFDAMEVGVPGAPRADELVYILAMSNGARIHERVGGLRVEQIARWDGQR